MRFSVVPGPTTGGFVHKVYGSLNINRHVVNNTRITLHRDLSKIIIFDAARANFRFGRFQERSNNGEILILW